jgi:prephenate dehydratase/prephenate dehydrogenase
MTLPTVALFGARGDMGAHVLTPLLEKKSQLFPLRRTSSAEEISRALTSEIIILSVPQSAVEDVLRGVQLSPSQLVIDICSVKHNLRETVTATGAQYFSVHPMNGPHTPWTRQKWVTVGEIPNHPRAQWFLDLLSEKKVMMHSVTSAEEHDLLMSIVLGMPQMVSVFLSEFLRRYAAQSSETLTLENVLKCTSPSFASLIKAHFQAVYSVPLWLRKDLLLDVSPKFLDTCQEVFRALADDAFFERIDAFMQQQLKDARAIRAPQNFESTILEYVTQDFHLMNETFLGRAAATASDLYVQKLSPIGDILPEGSQVSVGIHGIRGAFTDEAWHRFATEILHVPESRFSVVELVHSANVLRAVAQGEVDRGIFAFANSGSGGYVESIQAMGEYQFDVLALFTMPINMCILGHPDIHDIYQLDAFFGHPIALSQCRLTLAQRWPDIPVEPATDEMDTALSAKLLATGALPKTKGVFASKRAAEFYGLKVLAESVHHDPRNATAFAVVRRRA